MGCLIELLFPRQESQRTEPEPLQRPYCERCGEPAWGGIAHDLEYVCTDCQHRLRYFDQARSGYLAKGQVMESVIEFKYNHQSHHRPLLIAWLIESFDRFYQAENYQALVPVPLHTLRQRERGFNQAMELATGLGRSRSLLVKDLLVRRRETKSQTQLSRHKRQVNMHRAFALKPGFDVAGQNLLLIDDVYTTGSTTEACAHVLAAAGASRLDVLTIARS